MISIIRSMMIIKMKLYKVQMSSPIVFSILTQKIFSIFNLANCLFFTEFTSLHSSLFFFSDCQYSVSFLLQHLCSFTKQFFLFSFTISKHNTHFSKQASLTRPLDTVHSEHTLLTLRSGVQLQLLLMPSFHTPVPGFSPLVLVSRIHILSLDLMPSTVVPGMAGLLWDPAPG